MKKQLKYHKSSSDLINQLQGRPYLTYHRVGNDRTYYYHSGPNDNTGSVVGGNGYNYGNSGYGSSYYYGYSNINQIPRQEGYNSVYYNGQWQTAYQTECSEFSNDDPRGKETERKGQRDRGTERRE